MKFGVFLSYFIFAAINRGLSVRITRFVVPTVAYLGAVVDLDCAYDLEHDQLYDVKWYKDADEFFRCKSDGGVQPFDVEGVKLYYSSEATLGSCPVSLTILGNSSAGRYQCEISTEAPEFKTTARSVVLRISNIKPARRTQNDGNSVGAPVTEKSLHNQENGNQSNHQSSHTVIFRNQANFTLMVCFFSIFI